MRPSSSVLRATRASIRTFGCAREKRPRISGSMTSPKSSCSPSLIQPSRSGPRMATAASSLRSTSLRANRSMVSPASVNARLRPAFLNSGAPDCSSSFLICALTADVERPTRSAAFAKLPSSMPTTKVRNDATSKLVCDMADHPILSNCCFDIT